ncbi:MAG: carboxypeptidase-like regulatory domain-containing protein, partial [Bacteroidota bacterium]
MKKIFAFLLWISITPILSAQTQEYIMSFEIIIGESGIPLDNAQIAITPCACGGVTNRSGRFSIVLPEDTYEVSISYIGYTQIRQTVELN